VIFSMFGRVFKVVNYFCKNFEPPSWGEASRRLVVGLSSNLKAVAIGPCEGPFEKCHAGICQELNRGVSGDQGSQ
jgi:hypothetical protein